MEHSDNASSVNKRFTGRVKWFNNKSGYGFITAASGDIADADIFVHYSAINVSHQYKYLVQGEYVEFSLTEITDGNHPHQAGDVTGINMGQLICETRREIRSSLRAKKEDDDDEAPSQKASKKMPMKKTMKPKARGSGPRDHVDAEAAPAKVDADAVSSTQEEAISDA